VAQARKPAFYAAMSVPDTVEGRLELLILHMALVMRRLREADAPSRAVGQAAFDLFCTDMDRSIRELGVSDIAVPKKMKRMGEAFYGRSATYEEALAVPADDALAVALARNLYDDAPPDGMAAAVGSYVRAAVAVLAMQPADAIAAGAPNFPDPGAHVPVRAPA
jgi:cytochrome b pre-mRNA-processing protein 3